MAPTEINAAPTTVNRSSLWGARVKLAYRVARLVQFVHWLWEHAPGFITQLAEWWSL
ncbi:hypothetical protein [Tsukamurella asaccharolytica]|uniref:hypothetical protein n=1 Tax=Tsukamurella asaccharolytica TaxID=2592067 RepID=UPI001315406E|nr:hypothetical protein [Tsukamurella asaccharolytica]